MESTQNTLRDTLEANVEAAESGTLPTPEDRARDDQGRFAKKEEPVEKVEKPVPQVGEGGAVVAQETIQRPTTWKKEYLGIYDKLAQGQPLTPDEAKKLAGYATQRETEYKTGVSTYKAEATAAKELQEAVAPYAPELQSMGVTPSAWIKDVGQMQQVLLRGTPQQKFEVLQGIANRYGIPLQGVQQGGVAPIVGEFMQQSQALRGQVAELQNWKQQQEMQVLQSEVARMQGDTAKYPHFEAVREQMAQLLEQGSARDLESAYKAAVRLNDEIFEAEITRRLEEKSPARVVAQAKAKAVSPKSATPSGTAKASEAKDRRSVLAEQFDAAGGGRV